MLAPSEEKKTDGGAQPSLASADEAEGQNENGPAQRLLQLIRTCIDERKGRDVAILDLTELTPITDYFVICSGTSSMHSRAISDHIQITCKKAGFRHLGIEGEENAKWILIDYGDVVVHIFLDETRWFYNLERLWGDARRIDQEDD